MRQKAFVTFDCVEPPVCGLEIVCRKVTVSLTTKETKDIHTAE